MTIYVNELPKSCGDCVFCKQTEYCYYCDKLHTKLDYIDKDKDCPLQSLTDYTKQVRKEVVQEIKDLAGDYFELPICYNCGEASNDDVVLTGNDLTEILDQIQAE